MAINTAVPTAAVTQSGYTTHTVTSKDGTTIGYRQYGHGHGPGLVLVQGAMGTAQNFSTFAEALADTFTVYVPDRRGRGMSASGAMGVQRDVEDIDALLTKTGSHLIYGLSSGGAITLQAALTLPAIEKVVVYEPAFFVHGAPMPLMQRYENEMDQGKIAAALVTSMQATHMGPPIFEKLPRWFLELMTSMAMNSEDKKAKPGDVTMRKLASSLRYDMQIIKDMDGKLEIFRALRQPILLLGGSTSPAFLKESLNAFEKIIPQVSRVEFPGLGHAATWDYDKQRNPTGNPARVAQEIKRFLA